MIRYREGVFVRHSECESILWCPRYDGCVVLQDSQLLLDEIGSDWRDEDLIFTSMARRSGITINEIEDDFKPIVEELIVQGFILRNDHIGVAAREINDGTMTPIECDAEQCGMDLFASYCERNGILAELHIDLTDACTERCVHCYVPHGQHHFLPYAMVEKAIREFRAMNGFTVHLTGGEAMMHPDFERICSLCVELNLNFVVFSNMTLCEDERVAFLKRVRPQFINVSLYSMDAAEHDAITQTRGSWSKTVDAILRCCAAGVHCRIATPLLKENKDALPQLKKFAEEHQMYFVPNCEIVAQADHGCENLSHACSAKDLLEVLRCNSACFMKPADFGCLHAADDKVCDIGEGRLYLNARGEYYPCDSMSTYVVGNVRENMLADVWRGDRLDYLRSLRNADFRQCMECASRPWCKLCPAANYNATGDVFKHHPSTCLLAEVMREIYGGADERS